MMKRIVLLSCALMSAPAVAINKCVAPDGRTIYQAAPCAGEAKASEIAVQKAPPSTTIPIDTQAEIKQLQQRAAKAERERKIKELEAGNSRYRQSMTDELDALRNRKRFANNNLAGATWEQSLSDEMNAVTSKYDTLIRDNQTEIDRLRKEGEKE